jgi:hypothetical protein
MPIPFNVIKIKRFLGVVGYYRRYFRNFASKRHPCANYERKMKNSNGLKLVINLGSGRKHI